MRIVKVSCRDDDNSEELILDENNEFQRVKRVEYLVYLNPDDNRTIVENGLIDEHILYALGSGVQVFCSQAKFREFQILKGSIVTSVSSIIAFSTEDESKYRLVEELAKRLVNAIKKAEK